MHRLITLIAAALFAFATFAQAGTFDPSQLPQSKQTLAGKYLSAKQAYDLKMRRPSRVLFIDVHPGRNRICRHRRPGRRQHSDHD